MGYWNVGLLASLAFDQLSRSCSPLLVVVTRVVVFGHKIGIEFDYYFYKSLVSIWLLFKSVVSLKLEENKR